MKDKGTTLYSLCVCNVLGQRTQYTHPNGMRTEYDYDSWNREYDDEGRLSVADDWASRAVSSDGHEFAYDDNGRLLTYTDFDGEELNYTYDNMGRVVAMDAYEYNNNYAYTYNAAGRLYTTTAPGSKEWTFDYDAAGKVTSYTWPNGMSTHYTYDDDGRLTDIQHKDGATVEEGWGLHVE